MGESKTEATAGDPCNTHDHHVLIVGGGFAGLNVAQGLRSAPVKLTLIDKRNFHLFQPLLYQVATGGLSPANIAAPFRRLFRGQRNLDFMLGEVTGIDPRLRTVSIDDETIPYDTLVVAAGAATSYFGHNEWAHHSASLKSIEDATHIRSQILRAFESADSETDPEVRRQLLTFVIVGAGPTGVELAGTLSEIARYTLRNEYVHIDPTSAKIVLIDLADTILPSYDSSLSEKAQEFLESCGVEVRTGLAVTDVDDRCIVVQPVNDTSNEERIHAQTVLWAAGVEASPLGECISKALGIELDETGRVPVAGDLTVPGHPDIFVLGDLAHIEDKEGNPLPGVAQVAIQSGKHTAKTIRARLKGRSSAEFEYKNHGSLATIGRSRAVAEIGRLKFAGFFAWILWLFIHLMNIVFFENRLLVLIQWGWNYITWNRVARLIANEHCTRP